MSRTHRLRSAPRRDVPFPPAFAPAAILAAMLACALPARAAPIPDGAFVRVQGTRFVVGDRPFAFVGANLAAVQGSRERARHRETIAALAADGLTVGRVWALGEGPADASQWFRDDHLFRAGPEGFIEASYVQLDRVLAAAREAGVRLIVTLANQWADYGGVPMYLRWAGRDPEREPAAFWSDERARAFYRAHLDRLLDRTNTVTGLRYVDDPTIFAWELINESVAAGADAEARRRWIVEMARHIKARDPNHLVAAGLIGYTLRAERTEWVRVHRLPEIDYCDSHLYPQQDAGRVRSFADLARLVDDRAQLARFVVRKPLVIGEFGFLTADRSGRPTRRWLGMDRAGWFRRFLDRLFRDGGGGALAWIYQPWIGRPRDYGIYVDRPDTDDVRGALREAARRLAAGPPPIANPRLGPTVGDRLLYEAQVHLAGRASPHAAWSRTDGGGDERVLDIDPAGFAEARFDAAGTWREGALAHVYGAGPGRFVYRFLSPRDARLPPARLRIEARLSSEWPGAAGPPGGGSVIRVSLDGREIARLPIMRDDGAGRVEAIELAALSPRRSVPGTRPSTHDPLASLARPGPHSLVFEVPDGPDAHGLCIYGEATGRGLAPVGELGPIRLRWMDRR